MSGSGGASGSAAGGPARHVPVLLAEVLAALAPRQDEIFLDGTFGAGGYTRGILEAADCRVIALDRDPTAIAAGQDMVSEFGGRLTLAETEFANMEEAARETGVSSLDGIVLDIGVSSMQLDEAHRGFSFRFDGPLDMRMAAEGESAADIVNTRSEVELADIFYNYGEERLSRVIARAIVHDRKETPFQTTKQLADLIGRIVRSKPGDIHPATRSFQALRIAVNDELNELASALHAAERLLKPGGRLVIVSFHSLEDRIVKVFLATRSGRGGGSRHAPVQGVMRPTFRIDGKWPVVAGEAENAVNPRARSAKLRAAIRLDAPDLAIDPQVVDLARLPDQHPRKGAKRR
ncbi:MAG: 16S rRNA (cytosine(1402)-N(4))-methyltransferase RsmH [Rhabdaerophilum sp.]